ncbi:MULTISPECIES: hypothetical protein [Streptomyces]|uniref:Uncharacterized protein n=1 Tax=Streptomyces lycii TaxID=2654337 RepID=A0ABQ7FP64_9ACTN|nr:hypothetical protein [Streptomyces lycii]KAF4410470.1 hypothetical protein GCU69_03620 [Streptomyces lycii]
MLPDPSPVRSAPEPPPVRPTTAEANAAIRTFVAGRTSWSAADLAELDRLRQAWRQAVRDEVAEAA